MSEQHLNRFVNKILARPRTAREIVVFTEGAMFGAPSGDRETQHPHFTDVGIGSLVVWNRGVYVLDACNGTWLWNAKL